MFRHATGISLLLLIPLVFFQNCARFSADVGVSPSEKLEAAKPDESPHQESPDETPVLPSLPVINENQITRDVRAIDFVDSVGVNTHGAHFKNAYANASLIIQSLEYLGVDKVRDGLVTTGNAAAVLAAMADAGVKFDFVVSGSIPAKGATGISGYITGLKSFMTAHPGSVLSVEGLNEANSFAFNYNGDATLTGAAAFQCDLYTAIRRETALNDVLVVNLSLAYNRAEEYALLGNLASCSNAGNAHIYTKTPKDSDSQIEERVEFPKGASPGNPLFVTEIGHPTLATEPAIGTSETAQGKITLSELFLAYENGSRRTFIYELFDNYTEGVSRGLKEAYFGIFRADGTPKPAATTLRNTIQLLSDDGSTAVDGMIPTGISFQSSSTAVHAMILEKSAGVYAIVVWSDRVVWDDKTDMDITNVEVSTVVKFDRLEKNVRVYDPSRGLTPIQNYKAASGVELHVGDAPLIIEVGAAR